MPPRIDSSRRRLFFASFLCFIVLANANTQAASDLYISEFVASNTDSLFDNDGDSSDWIELTNGGAGALSLNAYFLSDDASDLEKWPFPDVELSPGEFLIVFASGKDRRDPAQPPHTNFQLDKAAGSSLILSRSVTGAVPEVVFQYLDLPRQHEDVSYGVVGGDVSAFGFFQTPTPGAANDGASLQGYVADTRFSVDRGLYDAPFELRVTCATPGATLIHTSDGSLPSSSNGIKTIPASSETAELSLTISTTSTIRAMAMKAGFEPTNVDTQTYIFPHHVLEQDGAGLGGVAWGHAGPDWEMDPEVVQHADAANRAVADDLKGLPSVCLSLPFDAVWGASGIYPSGQGVEKATAVELLNPDGDVEAPNLRDGFKTEGTVQIVGGTSPSRWKSDKLSMRLKFQPDLRFPVFGDKATDRFDTLVLDARLNNVWHYGGGVSANAQRDRAQYLRDQFAADLQRSLDGHAPHGQHVHLYINGIYWGIHTFHERPDDNFAASYLGGENEDYYVVKHTPSDVIQGGAAATADYNALHALADQDMGNNANYLAVAAKLNIDDFINYMLVNYYGGNGDWAHHNWYASRNFNSADGKWRFHSWDAEKVLEGVNDDRTGLDNNGGPTHLHRRLVGNANYRLRFADRVRQTFFHGGALTPEVVRALYLQRADNISSAIRAESARWGDNQRAQPYLHEDWQNTLDHLVTNYFPNRTAIVLNQFRSRGWYPDVDAPELSQHGGFLTSSDALSILGSGEIYYTLDGSDPRGENGQPSASAASYAGTSDTETLLPAGSEWKFLDNGSDQGTAWRQPGFDDSGWNSGAGKFGFGDSNEETTVSYGDNAQNKHVTTYFRTAVTVSDPGSILSATAMTLHDDGVVIYLNGEEVGRSNMPGGTISHDTFASVSHNNEEETTYFPIAVDVSKMLAGTNVLAAGVHQNSATSSDLGFDMRFTVTRASEGDGALRLDGPGAVTLRVRALDGGEWSAETAAAFYVDLTPTNAANVVISEIMYHPLDVSESESAAGFDNPDLFEFLEITNISGDWLSLQGLVFTDGIAFDFAASSREVLAPGESVLLVKDNAAFEARYGAELPVVGVFTGNLRNSGETLTLSDLSGGVIWSFAYDDAAPWPTAADGGGYSMVLLAAQTAPDPAHGNQWTASASLHGSPGSLEEGTLETYTLVTSVEGEGTVSWMPDAVSYASGQPVTLQAHPQTGWAFAGWSGDLSGTENPAVLTMIGDRAVHALFKRVYSPDIVITGEGSVGMMPSAPGYAEGSAVSLTPMAAAGYRFVGWSGDLTGTNVPLEVTIDSALTIGAVFLQEWSVSPDTAAITGEGEIVFEPSKTTYLAGEAVTVTAVPAAGFRFAGWTGGLSGGDSVQSLNIAPDLQIGAEFIRQYRVDTGVTGTGSILLDPDQTTIDGGTVLEVTAVPGAGWEFAGWGDGVEGDENPATVTLVGDLVVTAHFVRRHVLATAMQGEGSVTLSPPGGIYGEGTEVTATAIPSEGHVFVRWEGDLSGIAPSAVLAMEGDRAITAVFERLPSGYEAWKVSHFNNAERSVPEISGLLADPDGDRVVNLYEYGMGGDPHDPEDAPSPRAELVERGGEHYVRLIFPRLLDPEAPLRWILESSENLRSWTEASRSVTELLGEPSSVRAPEAMMEDGSPIGEADARFYRLTLQLTSD